MRASAHTHTQKYVILIAFPWQQWFHERTSVLRHTYVASFVISNVHPFLKDYHYSSFKT
jgi:hypothetical protein